MSNARFLSIGLCVALGLSALGQSGRAAAADPQALFEANCALCHQKGGVGVKGQFPRLAGRVAVIAGSSEGRSYLQHVVLSGMAGKVDVDGESIIGVMPGFGSLPDADLADVLTYLAQLSAPPEGSHTSKPFTADELKKTRAAAPMTPTEVNASRAAVLNAASHSKKSKS